VTKGFRLAAETLKPHAAFLLHGGDESWPVEHGITATSLPDLMRRLAKE
jgi:hypothetical protein